MRRKAAAVLLCMASLLLAGCEAEKPDEQFSGPDITSVPTTEPASETDTEPASVTAETNAPVTTSAETETETVQLVSEGTTVTLAKRLDSYASLYEAEVQSVWDRIYNSNDGSVSIAYVLYDINGDRIPELVLNQGTCEADKMVKFYTVDLEGKLREIAEVGGSHAVFARDGSSGDLALVSGYMEEMTIRRFAMDNDLTLTEHDRFEHVLAESESYEDVEWDNGVWRIDYISASSFDRSTGAKSYINHAYSESEETDGLYLDFTFEAVG